MRSPLSFVTIDSGTVRGVAAGDVIGFKGIPYAQPPFGALRWRALQPVEPWQQVREAAQFGPICMQPEVDPVSEDCLTINVWRPAGASDGPLPVMVWIYGGAMVRGGTSLYPADALARQGVIVVSMNYRLGRLGFFAHPALAAETPMDVRGNYGLMDQLAALQWVQRNIAAFGGDPKQVTIFGESAGGGSVMMHLTSPMSRGLFHRAMLQSPGIPTARAKVVPLTELADAEKLAVDYARSVGLTGTMHGFEIPYTFNIPAVLVGDQVTPADKAMGDVASAYWVSFGKTGDPNGGGRPMWPRHDPTMDRVIHFTNSGVIVGTDPLRARLDLWQRLWSQGR